MKLKFTFFCIAFLFYALTVSAQEALPIYSDYLTDNYYLLHPSMAGASNCGKIRLTGRQQWFGNEDAPSLQTLTVNKRIGDSPSALGAIVFADKNGYHSTLGGYLTYAHHIMFSRNEIDLNMLSFGMSAGIIQYKLDETSFINEGFDPLISGIAQADTNFNIDLGFSYNFLDYYFHATMKNILKNDGINFNENGLFRFDDLRTLLLSAGGVFGKLGSEWSYEPSVMYMSKSSTGEKFIDVNGKVYKDMEFGKLWGGLSYRRALDQPDNLEGFDVSNQYLQYITPFIGANYKNFVFAYTYSYQANSVVFNNGGFHQITLGFNFGCRREPYQCKCPAIN